MGRVKPELPPLAPIPAIIGMASKRSRKYDQIRMFRDEWIIERYREGYTARDIGEALRVTHLTVHRVLRENKVKRQLAGVNLTSRGSFDFNRAFNIEAGRVSGAMQNMTHDEVMDLVNYCGEHGKKTLADGLVYFWIKERE